MAYVGIHVHKKQRQMCLLTEAGSLPALMHPQGPHCARGVDQERVCTTIPSPKLANVHGLL